MHTPFPSQVLFIKEKCVTSPRLQTSMHTFVKQTTGEIIRCVHSLLSVGILLSLFGGFYLFICDLKVCLYLAASFF